MILDATTGQLACLEPGIENRPEREVVYKNSTHGRQLFNKVRSLITNSEEGAGIF